MVKNGLGVRQYVRPVLYIPRLFVVEKLGIGTGSSFEKYSCILMSFGMHS